MEMILNYKHEIASIFLLIISTIEQINPIVRTYSLYAGAIVITLTTIKLFYDIKDRINKSKKPKKE